MDKVFTRELAIRIAESCIWLDMTDEEIVRFQLFQDRLCMPIDVYRRAIEKVLGRPVYTHEFGWPENLQAEYAKERMPPTFEEIVAMIPADKLVLIEPQTPDNL